MLEKAGSVLRRFISDEQGLEAVEYAVIGGLVVTAVAAGVLALRVLIEGRLTALQNAINQSGS